MSNEINTIKNVIVVYDYAHINGGAAKVAIKSAVGLSKNEINTFFYSAVGPVCNELENSEVEVRCLDLQDINTAPRVNSIIFGVWNKAAEKDFAKYLKGFSTANTVVHFHGWTKALSVAVVAVAVRAGFRCAITLHDYFSVCPNGGFYDYNKKNICSINPMSSACVRCNCDKRSYVQKLWRIIRQVNQDRFVRKNLNITYISISDLNESVVRPYVKSKDFTRIMNPIDLSEYAIKSIKDNSTLIYVGRLSEEKGVEAFCEACSRLIKQGYNFTPIVVGNGPLLDTLQAQYSEIDFQGWCDSKTVEKYMLAARTLVFPSKWYEGAPLTIIEALSMGLPCLVSDCSSAVEFVDDQNGFVYKSGNIKELMDRMVLSLDDEAITERNNYIINHFDRNNWNENTHVSRLIQEYQRIIAK